MTKRDFRALCAELLQAVDDDVIDTNDGPRFQGVVDRARAALAQPEPVDRPTWTEGICGDGAAILKDGVMQPIESVIAALNAAELTQPEPQGPTDEKLTWLWNHVLTNRRQRMTWLVVDCLPETDYQQFARSVLRQWRSRPVPVAERLPGPEDLTDEHFGVEWCWWGKRFAGGWEWHQGGTHYGTVPGEFSHWLPHQALPVPQQEVQ